MEGNKQNKCEYCGEPHPSIVGLHMHLLEDHPQQVAEEREILAKEKAEKKSEKMKLQVNMKFMRQFIKYFYKG